VPFPFCVVAIFEIALASITDPENQSSKFVDHTHLGMIVYMYGVVARLAMLASSYEMEATDPEAELDD
jgi:hypothetical protein